MQLSQSLSQASDRTAATRFGVLLVLIVALSVYRVWARELLDLGLHFDEAQYWVWSLEPAFGYFSKPPLVAWAIGAARRVCGDGELCIRLPSVLALGATAVFVYLSARRLFDVRVAFWSAVLFLLAPLTAFLSWFITTDSLLLLAWAAALYCFVRALDGDRLPWWLVTGFVAGLGLLAKYTMGIFAVSALGYLLFARERRILLARPGPYLGALIAVLLFAPNLWWNYQHAFATFGHTAEISQLDEARASPLRWLTFVAEQFGVFGPLAMVALIAAAVALWRWRVERRHRAGIVLALWFALPFLAIISVQALVARAHANWAAPAYVAAALPAAVWLVTRPRHTWLIATLALNVVLMLGVYHYRQALPAAGLPPPKRDPMLQLKGWDGLGRAVEAQLGERQATLLTDDRRLLSWLVYYGGGRARDASMWNASGRVDNHYKLTRDVSRAPAGPFLFVSERDRGPELQQQFERVEPLGVVGGGVCDATVNVPCERRVYAYRLGAFRGYPPAGVR